jgi:hypothetical protein
MKNATIINKLTKEKQKKINQKLESLWIIKQYNILG